ncbi:long-chain fatty acid transport protein 2-like [Mytilus californianus]|uniref:long-chain fatty acid transport protein 2-like n=1 Tax=Mytilus californianus TaxID=6549 RepID=UPI0022480FDA|nr:long-chain fatty acid transport protein 2-like [Mytilus californianus]
MSIFRDGALLAAGGSAGLSLLAWRTLFPWIKYDIQTMKGLKNIGKQMNDDIINNRLLIDHFEASVKRFPQKTYIIYEDRCYSFEYVNTQACRVANIVRQWGLKQEDSVSILVHNSPDYIWTFLGLLKLGIIATLLNTNARGETLINGMDVTDTKAVIVGQGEDLYDAVHEIMDAIDVPVYVMGKFPSADSRFRSWDSLMMQSSPADISTTVRSHIDMYSPTSYLFTSGTTGLPKAAIALQGKLSQWALLFRSIDVKPDDVVYDVLPFYHGVGMTGMLSAASVGCSIVIRKKFSAHNFWADCRKYKVTIVQYIGELCRYVLAVPEDSKDGIHNVRTFIGNGLRQDIWTLLQKRFKIPKIIEFFGASEGTSAMVNLCNRPGAVGRISPLMNRLDPAPKFLVKYDVVTATPLRDKSGRCIKVQIGEPGLFICGIPALSNIEKGLYKGNMEMTEKKLVRNVFKEGDAYFNFGDSLYLDKDYFVYFHDRVGDTFRWKGENVSTTEVANIITALPFILDANVYGITVPGHDGRAGMASLTLNDNVELSVEKLHAIYNHLEQKLPKYARPIVLRLEGKMRTTGTFKQQKGDLMKEGFDPNIVSDPMFYMSTEVKTYVPLDKGSYHHMLQSKL